MSTTPSPQPSGMFSEPPQERSFPSAAVGIAAVAIVILVVVFVALSRRHSGADAAGQAYAANIAVSDLQVSAANSIAGGTTVYVDGHLTNNGTSTVTGVTLQATFAQNDASAPPQVESDLAKALRTKDPIDLEPMSSSPIAPGQGADFRLIFEDVKDSWDQQTPKVKVVGVSLK